MLDSTDDIDKLRVKLTTSQKRRNQIDAKLSDLSLELVAIQHIQGHGHDIKALFANEGDDIVSFDDAVKDIQAKLKNNDLRGKLRTVMSSLRGKVTIDTVEGFFHVFNQTGTKDLYVNTNVSKGRETVDSCLLQQS